MNCYKIVIYNRHGNSLNDCSASGYQWNTQTGSFQSRKAIYFSFSPSWVAHTYLRGPWRRFQHPHCVFHIVAAITMLMLIGCSLCDPSEQKLLHSITKPSAELEPLALYYKMLARAEEQWQESSEGKAKNNYNFVLEGSRRQESKQAGKEGCWSLGSWGMGQQERLNAAASDDRAAHMPEHLPLPSLCATAIQN